MSASRVSLMTTCDQSMESSIHACHIRTSLFWNIIIKQLGDVGRSFVYSSPAKWPDSELEKILNAIHSVLFEQAELEGFEVDEETQKQVKMVAELPPGVIKGRLDDIFRSYVGARHAVLSRSRELFIPTFKKKSSRASVRWSKGDFKIEGNTLEIMGRFGFKMEHPVIAGIQPEKVTMVSITRRRISMQSRSQLGLPQFGRAYKVTFILVD